MTYCQSVPDHRSYVAALHERMRADQRKLGKSAWTAAVERMERLQYAVSKETLQLMRAKEICLEQRKHGLKEEVSLAASPLMQTEVRVSVCLLCVGDKCETPNSLISAERKVA